MMNDIETAIKAAKTPGPIRCPECNEQLYAPMDKLSIGLYNKCVDHLEAGGVDETNLMVISAQL